MKKKKKRKDKKIIYIIIAIILLLNISFFSIKIKKGLNPVESIIKDGGLFIQSLIVRPFQKKDIDKMANENIISENQTLIAQNDALKEQLQELKEVLELNTILTDMKSINATTINRNIDYWYQTITIDKGEKNGIKLKMPVITNDGLIGFISHTSNFYSTVQLLTVEQLKQKISVKIKVGDNYIYGLLTSYNSNNGTFLVDGISSNAEIPIDAQVTTSGIGEMVPAGIVVGYVKKITSDNFDLARIVEVESKVNFDKIYYVSVLERTSDDL